MKTPLLASVLSLAVLAGACTTGPEPNPEASSSTPSTGQELTANPQQDPANQLLANLGDAYRASVGVWPGFDVGEYPVFIVIKDSSGEAIDYLAINHPAPDAIGSETTTLDASAYGFDSLHRIENPANAASLNEFQGDDLDVNIGGVSTYIQRATPGNELLDPTSPEFASTAIHELFHRYQDQAFAVDTELEADFIDPYPFAADNLELAVLEERALDAALNAPDDEARQAAVRHFAALRSLRLRLYPEVASDFRHETSEGTARYVEHLLGNPAYAYHPDNFDQDLLRGQHLTVGDPETLFRFDRFYASGAAIMAINELLGIEDAKARVEGGEAPAQILITDSGVTDDDVDRLVTEARTAYDPDGALRPIADKAEAAIASGEPLEGATVDDAASIEDDSKLTGSESDCLLANGIDLDGDEVDIPADIAAKCFDV